ncbi:hypothetical protein EVAR_27597_1 [Eumeta japonica]|uniref:RNA-directed DNA polymerase from mobile element jockey n=1 Tax=Eumeta variegata TaxID=151549 RepID=A0A4C1SJC2_EUMVA|nr:hypothetical protein EVAR_27597_1 [Eumeta japonica]
MTPTLRPDVHPLVTSLVPAERPLSRAYKPRLDQTLNQSRSSSWLHPLSPAVLRRAIDELGQWFRLWRIEVNPEKSAAIQFKYSKNRNNFVVDWNTPNLKMLNARIPWQ